MTRIGVVAVDLPLQGIVCDDVVIIVEGARENVVVALVAAMMVTDEDLTLNLGLDAEVGTEDTTRHVVG